MQRINESKEQEFWEDKHDQLTLGPTHQKKEIKDSNRIGNEQGNISTDTKEIQNIKKESVNNYNPLIWKT